MSRYANTEEHVRRATTLVDNFLFVGDQSRWNLSICLFNTILTGRRFLLPRQLANTRPTFAKVLDPHDPNASRIVTRDPIDGALWAHVLVRFTQDLMTHGVSERCCPIVTSVTELPALDAEPVGCRRGRARVGPGRQGKGHVGRPGRVHGDHLP